MTDSLTPKNQGTTDTFERFVALSAGEYWKAKQDNEKLNIEASEVLMIADIDYIDNSAHTIYVLLHPSKNGTYNNKVKMLVDDFLALFEYIEQDEAQSVREQEVLALQGKIQSSQEEMNAAFTDVNMMDRLIEQEMPLEVDPDKIALPIKHEAVGADVIGAIKTSKVTSLMTTGLTEKGIDQIRSGMEDQKNIALRRSQWITMRTNRLTKYAQSISPYFQEKAELALAKTADMRKNVDELMKGIATLNLYVLKNVEIDTIKKGVSAPEEEKLTLCQSVIYMDEELAVFNDIDDNWDCLSRDDFFKEIATNSELIEQIFPTTRCVLNIAVSRSSKDYSDRGYHPVEADKLNRENIRQYLFVRDGDNIHVVLSPELFHNYVQNLFPSDDQLNQPFKGYNGEDITYNDIKYTNSVKAHERLALGYKRLLILLCGLDHNKQLFGPFYKGEASLDFVSMAFQEKYFNFIHDADGTGMLPVYRPQTMGDWIKELNSEVTYGSTVLYRWREMFNEEAIPSAFERQNQWQRGSRSLQYSPTDESRFIFESFRTGVIKKKAGRMVIEIEVEGDTQDYKLRTFNATLDWEKAVNESYSVDFICVDRLQKKDADYFLHDRVSRTMNIKGIKLLKAAIKLSDTYRAQETVVTEFIQTQAIEAGITSDKDKIGLMTEKALAKWRCANPNKDFESAMTESNTINKICDQVFHLLGAGRDIKQEIIDFETSKGHQVVRVSLLTTGKHVAYIAPTEEETDDRLTPFTWVKRVTYNTLKSGVSRNRESWVYLSEFNNKESILFNSVDEGLRFLTTNNIKPFSTPEHKATMFENAEQGKAQYKRLTDMVGDKYAIQILIKDFVRTRNKMIDRTNSEYVLEPHCKIALGVTELHGEANYLSLVAYTNNIITWLTKDDDELFSYWVNSYTTAFARTARVTETLNTQREQYKGSTLYSLFNLACCDINEEDDHLITLDTDKNLSIIKKAKGYSWSFDNAINNLSGFQADIKFSLTVDSIDNFLGIKAPNNAVPCFTISNKENSDRDSIDVWHMDDYKKVVYFGSSSIDFYDSVEQAIDGIPMERTVHVANHIDDLKDENKYKEVISRRADKAPVTHKGITALKSFNYIK